MLTTQWIDDEDEDDVKYREKRRSTGSIENSEKFKFIIPLRKASQPGLETNDIRAFELDASSLEVARGDWLTPSRLDSHGAHATVANEDVATTPVETEGAHSPHPDDALLWKHNRSVSGDAPILDQAPQHLRAESTGSGKGPEEGFRGAAKEERREILGLPVVYFWLLVSVLVTLIAGGLAVGLVLGLRNSRQTDDTATRTGQGQGTPTAANQQQGVSSPAPVNPYCPDKNGTVVTPYDASGTTVRFNNEEAQSFTISCNTYWPARQGVNPGVRNIMVMYVPDMLTCLTLCAEYNTGYSDSVGDDVRVGGGICVGVALIRAPAEFCYLLNATGINYTAAAGGYPVDSALLTGNWSSLTSDDQTLAFGGILLGSG